jgi:hypothetical protein
MAIKVVDEQAYQSIGISLANVILTIRNTYSVSKNQGITSVNFIVYYFSESRYTDANGLPFMVSNRTLVVPEISTGNITEFIYYTLKGENPSSIDF